MPTWSEYREIARSRGALAFEVFMVESTPIATPSEVREVLPEHLEYQKKMEAAGKLFLAGPLSDQKGEEMSGGGLIIIKASSLEEARKIAEADPMHARGRRSFTIRRWLINEGALQIAITLSDQQASLS